MTVWEALAAFGEIQGAAALWRGPALRVFRYRGGTGVDNRRGIPVPGPPFEGADGFLRAGEAGQVTAIKALAAFQGYAAAVAGGGGTAAGAGRLPASGGGMGRLLAAVGGEGSPGAFQKTSVGGERLPKAGGGSASFSAGRMRQAVDDGERRLGEAVRLMRTQAGSREDYDAGAIFAELERRLLAEIGAG